MWIEIKSEHNMAPYLFHILILIRIFHRHFLQGSLARHLIGNNCNDLPFSSACKIKLSDEFHVHCWSRRQFSDVPFGPFHLLPQRWPRVDRQWVLTKSTAHWDTIVSGITSWGFFVWQHRESCGDLKKRSIETLKRAKSKINHECESRKY